MTLTFIQCLSCNLLKMDARRASKNTKKWEILGSKMSQRSRSSKERYEIKDVSGRRICRLARKNKLENLTREVQECSELSRGNWQSLTLVHSCASLHRWQRHTRDLWPSLEINSTGLFIPALSATEPVLHI